MILLESRAPSEALENEKTGYTAFRNARLTHNTHSLEPRLSISDFVSQLFCSKVVRQSGMVPGYSTHAILASRSIAVGNGQGTRLVPNSLIPGRPTVQLHTVYSVQKRMVYMYI